MKVVQSAPEFDALVRDHALVVADFGARWCRPCQVLKPTLEKLDVMMPGVVVAYVDVDACADLAETYHVAKIPTLLLFNRGVHVDTVQSSQVATIVDAIHEQYTAVYDTNTDTRSAHGGEGPQ